MVAGRERRNQVASERRRYLELTPDRTTPPWRGDPTFRFDRGPNRNYLFSVLTIELIISMPISVGSKAPDFTLKSKQPNGLVDIKLSNNFGKKNTVLLFFPAAFTSVCTQEMCDISAGLNGYSSLNAEVIGISIDTPFSQEAWAQKEKINIPLASDLNKEVIKQYQVVFPMLAGVGDTAARAAFVIDKNGVVQYSEQTPTPKDLPNFNKIRETLSRLK